MLCKYGNVPPITADCLLSRLRITRVNVQKWPFPAAQAMKSTRGCPTATPQPKVNIALAPENVALETCNPKDPGGPNPPSPQNTYFILI